MAYDRYDARRGRDSSRQSGSGERGRGDERGFFERAGDEIASWFGDDDDRERRPGSERGRSEERWGGDRDRERGEWRGSDRSRFDRDDDDDRKSQPMNWTSSNSDYRSGGREGGYRPMTGDYGRSQNERDDYSRTSYAGSGGSGRQSDRHYHEWRQRQLDELDRDYDDYHRERQQHFENDFGSWRQGRQQKRQMLSQAREHMEVVGSDGETVGKVDRIAGDRVILTKTDSPDGRHHSLPCTMIDKIEDERVILDCTAERAQEQWRDDDRERALFEREDQGEGGAHMLDRSFSGTYRK